MHSSPLKPVFIVGQYKCGSTWLLHILSAHPQVIGIREIDIVQAACHVEGSTVRLRSEGDRLRYFFDQSGWCIMSSPTGWDNTDTVARLEQGEPFESIPPDPAKPQRFANLSSSMIYTLYHRLKAATRPKEALDGFLEAVCSDWQNMSYVVLKAADQLRVFEALQSWQPQAKKIVITRDGRDAATSAVHFRKLMREMQPPWFKENSVRDYWSSFKAWMDQADKAANYARRQELKVVRYEDLTHDFSGTVKSLLAWLELENSDEIIEDINARTSFKSITGRSRGTEANHVFRKGAVNEWLDVLTSQEKAKAWELGWKQLTTFGYTQTGELVPLPNLQAEPSVRQTHPTSLSVQQPNTKTNAVLIAIPNPVPIEAEFGITTITWDTGDGSAGEVYVSQNGKPEKLFTRGARGSENISWIKSGLSYQFRLYAGRQRENLLAAVTVTGEQITKTHNSNKPSQITRKKISPSDDRPPSGLKLFRLRSYAAFLSHSQKMTLEYARRQQIEDSLRSKSERSFSLPGFSYPAGKTVKFSIDYRHSENSIKWREQVVCPETRLNNRLRATVHLLDAELAPYPDDVIYISEQKTPLFSFLSKSYFNLIGSEYLGSEVDLGKINREGIRNEDLTQLTLADSSVDYVLSFDCFEHIPGYLKAFAECCRVLKPNGKMLWSVPFIRNKEKNTVRARISPDGSIEHLLEPEYHGDPLSKKADCLCFTHFGWEILSEVKQAGFSDAYAVLFWSLEYGYLGGEQALFVAIK